MLRSITLILILCLLCGTMVFAQNGSVQGIVNRSDGHPADDAIVTLDAVDGGGQHHFHAMMFTNRDGAFNFHMIPPGAYSIAANLWFEGFASDLIDVVAEQTTHVTLTLARPDSGHHNDNELTPIDLQGAAIVVGPDTQHPVAQYLLNTDNQPDAEYILSFGPPWYDPDNGTHRPNNGDRITIHGGLFSYGQPPMVVVYQIDGHFWRDPDRGGHGGYGGDHGSGCDPDSVTRIELEGRSIVTPGPGWHGEEHNYALDVNHDQRPDYLLDFGAADYDPGNGAHRPLDTESDSIVGGRIFCPGDPLPIVIVYEINGHFWRQPGDTTGMGPMIPDAAGEPVAIGAPASYLTTHNYPNPFNPTTTISYSIPIAGDVRISVYDITGREVTKLVESFQQAGSYAVAWDGSSSASGIYFYRVTVNGLSFSNRMVLMK